MSDTGPIIQPEKVLQARIILQGSTKVPQLLIQWEGMLEQRVFHNYTT